MRPVADHQSIGARLLSMAMLAGVLVWMLGWLAVDALTPGASLLGRTLPVAAVDLAPPPPVRIRVLDPVDSG